MVGLDQTLFPLRAPAAGIPYLIEVVGVTVDPEVAVQRGIVRAITSGRGVPAAAELLRRRGVGTLGGGHGESMCANELTNERLFFACGGEGVLFPSWSEKA